MRLTLQQLTAEIDKIHTENVQWMLMATTLLQMASKQVEPKLQQMIDDFLTKKDK